MIYGLPWLIEIGGIRQHFAEFLCPRHPAVLAQVNGLPAKRTGAPSASVVTISIQADHFDRFTGTSEGRNKLHGSRLEAIQQQNAYRQVEFAKEGGGVNHGAGGEGLETGMVQGSPQPERVPQVSFDDQNCPIHGFPVSSPQSASQISAPHSATTYVSQRENTLEELPSILM
jgi:hypothetical protein